jgi:catechol 2,3-dioxygenase-like lactoylglutathione lyase family enzyme
VPLGCCAATQDDRRGGPGSHILLRPSEPERSRQFYRDTLGLPAYREFGHLDDPGLVFSLGGGDLERPVDRCTQERLGPLDSPA